MVFDIAVKITIIVVGLAFKLSKNLLVGLAEDVGKRGQATPVGHADDHLTNAVRGAMFNHRIEGGNQRFPAFQREPLLSDEFLLQEFFEERCLAQLFENLLPIHSFNARPVRQLNRLANPLLPLDIADVHVLDANAVAVGLLQMRHDVAQFCRPDAHLLARLEHGVQVGITQAKMTERHVGGVLPSGANGIRLGEEVTAGPVAMDQVKHLKFLERLRAGAVFAVVGQGQIKPPKKKPPTRVDGLGVLFVLTVKMVERADFGVAQEFMRVHVDWSARVTVCKDTNCG